MACKGATFCQFNARGWRPLYVHARSIHTTSLQRADHYNVLGVGKSASSAEIKKAYFKAAQQHHPDHNKSTASKKIFAEASAAYDVLKDPEKRRQYDQSRNNPFASQTGPRSTYTAYSNYSHGGSTGSRYQQRPEYQQRASYETRSRTQSQARYKAREADSTWENIFRQHDAQDADWNRWKQQSQAKREYEQAQTQQWEDYYRGTFNRSRSKSASPPPVVEAFKTWFASLPLEPYKEVLREMLMVNTYIDNNQYYTVHSGLPNKFTVRAEKTNVIIDGPGQSGGFVSFPSPNTPFVSHVLTYNNQASFIFLESQMPVAFYIATKSECSDFLGSRKIYSGQQNQRHR